MLPPKGIQRSSSIGRKPGVWEFTFSTSTTKEIDNGLDQFYEEIRRHRINYRILKTYIDRYRYVIRYQVF